MKLKKGKSVDKMAKKHAAKNKEKKIKSKKKSAAPVTTDEFFNQDFENMDISSDSDEEIKIEKKRPFQKKDTSTNNSDHDSDSGNSNLDPVEHKKSLNNLKDTDPEFFNYLIKHDTKLLDFNVDDDDDEDDKDKETDSKHVPNYDLEVASDESDFEPDDRPEFSGNSVKVNLKLLETWEEEIQKDKSSATIKKVVEAFHAALETVSDSEKKTTQYLVEGARMFNGIVQLCMVELPDAFKRFLNLGEETRFEAHKAKRFPKVKGVLKSYLFDLIKVIENVSSANIVVVLLKHLHQMLPYIQSFSSIRKPLLRILLKHWSTGEEETIRVVAFLCIIKIVTTQPSLLGNLQKTMYIKYIENSKFVSPTTLPSINFMRRSLVELYLLDTNFSYHNAFIYVRQLAIHLRNALTLKKKEHFQAVYNWQYINALKFWSELIPLSEKGSLLQNLEYPLVQITLGVIKLIPTSRYYPLRFHCIRMLMNITKEAGTFIPYLPLIFDLFVSYDFNRKHKIVSMKPMSLLCLLKVSKSQSQENGYKDAIIETIYELMLESAANDSHLIYFPDLYVFSVIKMKEFLKKCKVAKYCRKIKQLLDKIDEGRKFLDSERSKEVFNLSDLKAIGAWETRIKNKGTPVTKFYETWIKFHKTQQLKLVTKNDEIGDFKLPTIKRSKRSKNPIESEDSDLEIPVEEMEEKLKKAKKSKKTKKKITKTDDTELPTDNTDIVQDIKMSDWD